MPRIVDAGRIGKNRGEKANNGKDGSTLSGPVYEIEVQIRNVEGLHMRPAMQFVDTASRFHSKIEVTNDETSVDAKSIMQMTMLAATCGTKLRIKAAGDDAEEAIHALRRLVEVEMFGETPAPRGDATESG